MGEQVKEIGYAIVKGSVGSIPLAGGVLSELFGMAFSDPATKRREQVLLEMDERLIKLESEGYDIQKLAESEEFLSIAMQAYNLALKTHQSIKRTALMNAISNTPKLSIDENFKQMYLTYLDDFNEWHFKILNILDNPLSAFQNTQKPKFYSARKATILTTVYPELSTQQVFYDRIVNDLFSRGLIDNASIHLNMTEEGIWQSGTTDFGKQFLSFISE